MNIRYELVKDENQFLPSEFSGAIALNLADCLKRRLLISPDSGKELVESKMGVLTDGEFGYTVKHDCPVLYPKEILDISQDGVLPQATPASSLQQYFFLSQIKQSGEINAPLDSGPARKHQFRFKEFCKDLKGLILDIGSDKPSHSMQFLPSDCEYLGLDPYAGHGEFRIIGLGEVLPINDSSVDAVLFNTSLDHILDYHTAIDEAYRVLRPGGRVVISTYAWLERATLLTDSVHFHHFREFEIFGTLERHFEIEIVSRYEDPKHATHRYGLYVLAKRRVAQN
jgi:SAM-dependent methyltransferase